MAVITAATAAAGCAGNNAGEALFRDHCSFCHPDGGNIRREDKGLTRADLLRNNISSSADIVAYLRRPGPDMPAFDGQALPDRDAAVLADYILKKFR